MLIIFDSGPLLVTQACNRSRRSSFRGCIYCRSEGEEGDDWDSDDGLHGDEGDGIGGNLKWRRLVDWVKAVVGAEILCSTRLRLV